MHPIVTTPHGRYHIVTAAYHRNGVGGLGFYAGIVLGLDGEHQAKALHVVTLLSNDSEAPEYDGVPVFVTDPGDMTQTMRGDQFAAVGRAIVDTAWQQHDAKLAAMAADPTRWGDPQEVLTGEAAAAYGRAVLDDAGADQQQD